MRGWIELLRGLVARLRGPLFGEGRGSDPYAGVRQPRGGQPGGRTTAIALEEPDEMQPVNAVGAGRSARR